MTRACARTAVSATLLLAAVHARATAAQTASVEVEHHGAAFTARFDAVVDAPLSRVYAVLTDFPALPELNPDIVAVSVQLPAGGRGVRVRSVLKSCIWFFCRKVVQVEDVVEPDAHTIKARIVPGRGDFKSGWSDWRLTEQGGKTHLHYEARRVPDFWLPPLIGPWAVEHALRSQIEATIPALERLAATARPGVRASGFRSRSPAGSEARASRAGATSPSR